MKYYYDGDNVLWFVIIVFRSKIILILRDALRTSEMAQLSHHLYPLQRMSTFIGGYFTRSLYLVFDSRNPFKDTFLPLLNEHGKGREYFIYITSSRIDFDLKHIYEPKFGSLCY